MSRTAKWLRSRLKRLVARVIRLALLQYARSGTRPAAPGSTDVTFLLSSAWGMGGTIRATLNLAGALADRYDVEIISLVRNRDRPFFPFPPGVTVRALDDRRRHAAPRRLAPRLVRKVLRRVPSALVHPADRLSRASSLWSDVRLTRLLRGRTGFLIGTRPGLNLIAADLRSPVLVAIGQEHMHLSAHRPRLRRAIEDGYGDLDALVVLTASDLGEYRELLGDQVRLEQVPNGVRRMSGGMADPGGTVMIAAGRFKPQKGFDMLIRAFGEVAQSHPDWRLRIVGRGALRRDLEQMIDERALGDAASLPRRARKLDEELAAASVFVLSSRFEGFPVILLEAMSKGLATVSFDCPTGPREVIEDHRNGLLVPAEDVKALAAGMRELMEDADLRRRLGAAAAETARSYALEAIAARWEALLGTLRSPADDRRG